MGEGRATSDPADRKRVIERVTAEEVDFVLLWFTDIVGQLKSFAITVQELENALDDGMGFDGSSITGFNPIEESDMVAIPDPRTFQVMPWHTGEHKVARLICDVVTPDGAPYEGDPRYVLKRALERMRATGFDTFNVGPELEYFYFKDDDGTDILDHGGYFDLTTLDAASEWRKETIKAGANQVYGPTLSISEQSGLYSEALKKAYADAAAKAKTIAAAAGVSLGRVLNVVEGGGMGPFPVAEAAAGGDKGVPIEPGVQEIPASLTVTFAIS